MKRILIIEDDTVLNDTLSFTLRKSEYTVDSAYNGNEAFQYIRKYFYTLIILDINLPDTNGFDLFTQLKSQLQCGIIFLTGWLY